jgi:membrane-associated phospholipid phosphatase
MRRRSEALIATLACLAGLTITGVLARLVPATHAQDVAGLHGFARLNEPPVTRALDVVAHLADPRPYGLWIVALALLAAARRRWSVAAAIPVVGVGAPLSSEMLKPLLAQPSFSEWLGDSRISAASWPSGHATASMTVALCAVLAAPAAWRWLAAAAGGAFALAVSYSILALGWHFPSDVFGGLFMAGLWVSAAVTLLLGREPAPRPVLRRPVLRHPAGWAALAGAVALGAAALAVAGLAGVVRMDAGDGLVGTLAAHRAFVAGAVGIAALAAMLAAGLARGARL